MNGSKCDLMSIAPYNLPSQAKLQVLYGWSYEHFSWATVIEKTTIEGTLTSGFEIPMSQSGMEMTESQWTKSKK
ncbi:hypothetical protein FRB95_011649 [Tulasnella sp. JGI-2019a]|nr:hypothetical protein FRB95_011649 [Tulasnella sp. JGI-2019a]